MSMYKIFLALLSVAVSLNYGHCGSTPGSTPGPTPATTSSSEKGNISYVTLVGTDPSDPPMECEENNWKHKKLDGNDLDVKKFSGGDGFLKVEQEKGKQMFSLVITLSKEEVKNYQQLLGEWRCNERLWIVKGKPFIQRLGIKGDEEKHPSSVTVNEGNAVKFECEAYVVAEDGVTPVFDWTIQAEEGVTDEKNADKSKWRKTEEKLKENYWMSSYELVKSDGVTKEDRYEYTCTVKINHSTLETSNSILLRVKGKFAILWPAIGILIEVLLLVIVTWIYEKRKKAKSESEATPSKDADSSAAGPVQE